MRGPSILVRSISPPFRRDRFGNQWQYHSRSDHHSKVACWALLFDLLESCPLLARHVRSRKIGFGINHEMRDFKNNRKKNLDLVLCTPGSAGGRARAPASSFAGLAKEYGIELTGPETTRLAALPEVASVPVGSVHVAVEAKAAMTEHIKALPRLYDELNSSHQAIHGSADNVIAAGLAIVNLAATFVSPGRNAFQAGTRPRVVTEHDQPKATLRTLDKLKEIPRRTTANTEGFDALGIIVLDMKNDGSPVRLVTKPPAPDVGDVFHYDQMVRRIASAYASKFADV